MYIIRLNLQFDLISDEGQPESLPDLCERESLLDGKSMWWWWVYLSHL